jgi:acetyl-CoA C-acetyltransferase
MIDDKTPVIIGVGQSVERIDAPDYVGLSAADLAAQAARRALADTGVDPRHAIDAIAAVRTFDDSFPFVPHFGVPDKFPRAVARRLGINPAYATLGPVGGDTPLALLGQMGARIAAGETKAALIVGGEAISTVRHLQKLGDVRDWTETDDGPVEDGGAQLEEVVKPYQVIHGLRGAPVTYGLFENARRARLGLSKTAYAREMGALMAHFMPVAAANPYAAAVVTPMSPGALVDVDPRNRMVADPYPLRIVSRDQVNQGAALVMTSVGTARALGIDESRWVYVHGLALGTERDLIERPDLGAAPTGVATIEAALASADATAAEMAHFDFYSCFPIAVFAAAVDGLGMAADDPRGLSVTGGLPFFGGPGNNYTTHAIATMVERLRADEGSSGLVFSHGGYMSKFGAAVLSSRPGSWSGTSVCAPDIDPPVAVNWHPTGTGRILTHTILYANGHPVRAVVVGELVGGARFIANEADAETLAHLVATDPIGAAVTVSHAADGNSFRFA